MVAEAGKRWETMDWHEDVQVTANFTFNLDKIMEDFDENTEGG